MWYNKLKACVCYISFCFTNNPNFKNLDVLTLNKILWQADLRNYLYESIGITQGTFIKTKNGPYIRGLIHALFDLQKHDVLCLEKRDDEGLFNIYSTGKEPVDNRGNVLYLNDHEKESLDLSTQVYFFPESSDAVRYSEIINLAENGEELPLFIIYANKIQDFEESEKEALKSLFHKLQTSPAFTLEGALKAFKNIVGK